MEASQLLQRYRQDTDDTVGPSYRTDDATFFGYLTEAEDEACVRALLLRDDTSALTRVQLAAGSRRYKRDTRIIKVESAALRWPLSTSDRLCPLDVGDIGDFVDNGRSSGARPRALYVDRDRFILDPIPNSPGVLQLVVYRRPMAAIEDGTDEPEIAPQHHLALLEWCKFRAFSTKDAEAEDPKRAEKAQMEFVRVFGPRPSAWAQRHRIERRRRTTRTAPLGGIY